MSHPNQNVIDVPEGVAVTAVTDREHKRFRLVLNLASLTCGERRAALRAIRACGVIRHTPRSDNRDMIDATTSLRLNISDVQPLRHKLTRLIAKVKAAIEQAVMQFRVRQMTTSHQKSGVNKPARRRHMKRRYSAAQRRDRLGALAATTS